MANTNMIGLQGRINRIDVRRGLSKANAPFASYTFTLDIDGDLVKVESFAMKLKANGEENTAYKGLETLLREAKALYKTVREVGADKAEAIEDETIVENIDECDALDCQNWKQFIYTRFEENAYAKDGQMVRGVKIVTARPKRVDENKKAYTPVNQWEISGVITKEPVMKEMDEKEFLEVVVTIPIYNEAYGERQESVTLHEVTLQAHSDEAIEYIMDTFNQGMFVYLNGKIVRTVERIEIESFDVETGRGFGKKIEKQPNYSTKVTEYFEILGGWELEEEEYIDEPSFNMELWKAAKEEKEEKERKMLEGDSAPQEPQRGFRKKDANIDKPKTKKTQMPF